MTRRRQGACVSMIEATGPGRRTTGDDEAFLEQLSDYRNLRERLERSVLPRATSVDGVQFQVQASLHDLMLRRGGYVQLGTEGQQRLGQITDLDVRPVQAEVQGATGGASSMLLRLAEGTGLVLDSDGTPFHDAPVRPAESDEVGAWFRGARPARAGLVVGDLLLAPGVPAVLDAGGLNRHTFMCGQSGSGKTYSLGLLLERVLAETSLRIVILDPNSDYVGLGLVRDDADPSQENRYAHVPPSVTVWGSESADRPLRLAFAELSPAAQAGILGLDPIRDREEYALLVDLLATARPGKQLISGPDQLLAAESDTTRRLGRRAANLGLFDWAVWSRGAAPSLIDELRNPTARCTVVDLGSLGTVGEQRVVAAAVLSTLWGTRHEREPCLVVIDEAHNICSADPRDAVSALSTEQAVQIAAEGRKYGLYLLVSTQRPYKVHENVVSQCDNLLLMRMNSEADLSDLGRLFSFVPTGLMAGATSFGLGQALIGGRVFPRSGYVQMGRRVTHEGGVDVPATWAETRPPSSPTGP